MFEYRTYELKNKMSQVVGKLSVERFNINEVPNFVDYLRSGWGISLHVAIDFTGSNGDPQKPESLHYIGGFN